MTAEPWPCAPTEARADSMTIAGATGSTSTSIVPPQASPTSHACSSLIP